MSDYDRIAQVIDYLNRHHVEQPDLDTLAAQVGLSTSYFHRLFKRWAGATPKDFLQCLTLAHAKELLRSGQTVLDTALDTGLSSPGRLHDLCVSLEAATPGELKSGGASLEIRYGFAETPFGEWLVGESSRGICHVAFVEPDQHVQAVQYLQSSWPEAGYTRNDTVAERLAVLAFRKVDEPVLSEPIQLQAWLRGTPFEIRVWRALLQIPTGSVITYGKIAALLGRPAAARAVGNAVGSNPLAYLIPCHRVIRRTGVVGDYRWGQIRKHAMLAWEASRCRERSPQPGR